MLTALIHVNLPGGRRGEQALRDLRGIASQMPGVSIRRAVPTAAGCDLIVTRKVADQRAANEWLVDMADGAHAIAGAHGVHRQCHTRSRVG